jgi:hypothetical protein
MKKLLCLTGFFTTLITMGQDCSSYYFMKNKKSVEMAIFNNKGEPTGTEVFTVTGVTATDAETSANVSVEQFNKKGKRVMAFDNVMKCNGGALLVDFKFLTTHFEEKQYELNERKDKIVYDLLEYPTQLTVGQHLKDGIFHNVTYHVEDQQLSKVEVVDRTVEAKESITTKAGTCDCFRISYKVKILWWIRDRPFPIQKDGVEWYAPGFGVVKTVFTGIGSSELVAIH